MEKYYKQRSVQLVAGIVFLVLSVSSCKKFVDIDLPPRSLLAPYVLETNSTLVAALNGVYSAMAASTGDAFVKPALFADELVSGTDLISSMNTYMPTDPAPYNFFAYYYKVIYNANYLLNGLESPGPDLSQDTVKIVKGECYFLRAFSHFQLTNFYGTPPLVLSTNYKVAAFQPNSPVETLYGSIISDLKSAIELLPNAYPETASTPVKRVRVNKQAANALLAKVYLYRKDWANAITAASNVIAADTLYTFAPTIGTIFTTGSKEIIWQIFNTNGVTPIGATLIPSNATVVPSTTVRDTMLRSFDTTNDLRYKAWFQIQTPSPVPAPPAASKYWYAFKYKSRAATGTEYLVQFRLAELLLTRAEALAQTNKVSDALADVQKIRNRAGLITPLPASITAAQLLDTIALERKRELVFEVGNRWFDLNRTGKTEATLKPIKPDFKSFRTLLPYSENTPGVVGTNPNLEQNPGYH